MRPQRTPINAWYASRHGKCRYNIVSPDGLRQTPCERWAKAGTAHCPVHLGTFEVFDAQQATVVIAAFFRLLGVAV